MNAADQPLNYRIETWTSVEKTEVRLLRDRHGF